MAIRSVLCKYIKSGIGWSGHKYFPTNDQIPEARCDLYDVSCRLTKTFELFTIDYVEVLSIINTWNQL